MILFYLGKIQIQVFYLTIRDFTNWVNWKLSPNNLLDFRKVFFYVLIDVHKRLLDFRFKCLSYIGRFICTLCFRKETNNELLWTARHVSLLKKKKPHSSGDIKNSLLQRFGQCINVPHSTIFKTDKSHHKLLWMIWKIFMGQ